MRRIAAVLLAAAATACCLPTAQAGDMAEFKRLKSRYDKLARNQDRDRSRERRALLLDLYDHRDLKACRKLLKSAFDDERTLDNRVSVVHVLAGCGDPKVVDFLVSGLKKERHRAPVIALGEALGYAASEDAEGIAARAAAALRKSDGDLRLALIEGLGRLKQPAAVEALEKLGEKLMAHDRFERNVAYGACGGEAIVPGLVAELEDPHPQVRLGAVLGLAQAGGDAALTALEGVLGDRSPRVVEAAARALAAAGRDAAAPALVKAFTGASLRTREELRSALRQLTGSDLGHDAEAWTAQLAAGTDAAPRTAADLPKLPTFFGKPIASNNVAILLDLSGSMDWMGRFDRTREEAARFVESLDDDTSFVVYGVSRDLKKFADGPQSGAAARAQAATWIRELLTGRWFDLKQGLLAVPEDFPDADTIVVATDSHPWGTGREETSRETMEVFRQFNRPRRLRLAIALVMPGGRDVKSEPSESEFEERIDFLSEMADVSGGVFVHVVD